MFSELLEMQPYAPHIYIGADDLQTLFGQLLGSLWPTPTGPWFNIKMTSYQYRKSHCGDKTILRPSYLHNGISYTGKTTSLYWIRTLGSIWTQWLGSNEDCVTLQINTRGVWRWYDWCCTCTHRPGPRLNIKTVLSTYGDFHVKDKTAVRTSYL